MSEKWNPRRRRFLEAAVATAALDSACSRSTSPWRWLTVAEAETAAAICECLIPTDEFPGAAWAGAVRYLDRQLSGHLRRHRMAYRKAFAALEGFARAPQPRQVEWLREVEKGKAAAAGWTAAQQRQFFALILSHTMQSYYGDPRHGGNREQVGYRMLGIPATPVRGRNREEA